jgi:hypothetical protein
MATAAAAIDRQPGARAGLVLAHAAAEVFEDLAQRVHPAWIESLGAGIDTIATRRPILLGELLLTRFDLRWPDLSAATEALERVWLLPPPEVRRLCGARALFGWRDALKRSVDGRLRRHARALVGDSAFDIITGNPDPRPGTVELPSELEPDWVCTQGWTLLKSASDWPDARSRRLVDLMLPPNDPGAPALPAIEADHGLFMAELPTILPEYPWLFG